MCVLLEIKSIQDQGLANRPVLCVQTSLNKAKWGISNQYTNRACHSGVGSALLKIWCCLQGPWLKSKRLYQKKNPHKQVNSREILRNTNSYIIIDTDGYAIESKVALIRDTKPEIF
jgi:hypothetical protein